MDELMPFSFLMVLQRNPSLRLNTLALIDCHHRARSGTVFAVAFDSLRILLPCCAWKDSNFSISWWLRIQFSQLYRSTGNTQVSHKSEGWAALKKACAPKNKKKCCTCFLTVLIHNHITDHITGQPGAKYLDGALDRDFVYPCPKLIQGTGISGCSKYLTFFHIQLQTIGTGIAMDHLNEGIEVVLAVRDCSDVICMCTSTGRQPIDKQPCFAFLHLSQEGTKENRRGDRTEPWQTPLSIVKGSDRWPFERTLAVGFVYHDS